MKVNLLYDDPKGARQGHFNVDPKASPRDDPHGRTPCPLDDLSAFVEDAEATELIALDVLSLFPCQDSAERALGHWRGKVRRGGVLTLSFYSASALARKLTNGDISLAEFNLVFFGRGNKRVSLDHDLVKGWMAKDPSFELTWAALDGSSGLVILKYRREG